MFFRVQFKILLLGFTAFLGTVPIIRCPKGNAAEMVAEVIQPEIIIACKLSERLYTLYLPAFMSGGKKHAIKLCYLLQGLKNLNSSCPSGKQLSNFSCPGQVLVPSSLLSWETTYICGPFPLAK